MKIRIKILLLIVLFLGFFALFNQAQAGTASYTVNFATTLDGFTYVNESCAGGGTCTQGFTGADGNPAGGLYAKVTGKNKKNLGYFTKSLTWQDMGVPAGSIVTQVDGKFDVKLAQETHTSSQSVGLKLYDLTDTVNISTGGVDIETEFDPTSSSWVIRNTDGAKTIQSAYADSATTVTIRMRSDVNSGNNNGAATEVRMDTIVFTITYNEAPTLSIAQPDGTSDTIAQNGSYNITYTLADSDDIVTAAFYYDTDTDKAGGTAITGACASAGEGTNATCSWNTAGVSPGSYYIYGVVSDGITQVSSISSGQITINAAPTLTVSQPDGVSDTVNVGSSYNITFDLADSDDAVTTDFYYDDNGSGYDGVAIAGCQNQNEGTGAICAWDTTGMTLGDYYVYGCGVDDGVNPEVCDYSPGVLAIQSAGTLSVGIVDSGGTPVGSPSVTFSAKTFGWSIQQSTGTLGISSEKIRVTNGTGIPAWTLSVAASSGPSALWQSGGNNYDFNGAQATGRLRADASGSIITPEGGCSSTGLSKGSATYFSQGSQDSIDLVTADGTANTGCYWDITGIGLSQDIPASQVVGSYSIVMTLTVS